MLLSPTVVEWWTVAQAILQKAEDGSPASGAQRPPGMGKLIPAPWKGAPGKSMTQIQVRGQVGKDTNGKFLNR